VVRKSSSEQKERTADETPGAIRVGVGLLVSRVGDPMPWPFQRVRLAVEDSGCGMTPEQLERVLSGAVPAPRGKRGIGLRVVRELVAASKGELRMMSAPGIGTRVQIEWPMAAVSDGECADEEPGSRLPRGVERRVRRSEAPREMHQPRELPAPRQALSRSAGVLRSARSARAAAERTQSRRSTEASGGRWVSC
jgi:hypothetical protein